MAGKTRAAKRKLAQLKGTEEDEKLLLNIFPLEIWQNVVTLSSDPLTPHRVYLSSPFLSKSLESTRVQTLFPQVVNVLFPWLLKDRCPLDTTFYELLMNLRLVCRSWCRAVELFLEDPAAHKALAPKALYTQCKEGFTCKAYPLHLKYFMCKFDAFETLCYFGIDIGKFRAHFDETHLPTGRNPFIGRNLALAWGSIGQNPYWIDKICELLEQYGHHIWFLDIRIVDTISYERANRYLYLQRVLQYFPNLKVLSIFVCVEEELTSIEPMPPPFKNIETLECVKIWDLPEPILDELRCQNPDCEWQIEGTPWLKIKKKLEKERKWKERRHKPLCRHYRHMYKDRTFCVCIKGQETDPFFWDSHDRSMLYGP